jgi:hypothetical protein
MSESKGEREREREALGGGLTDVGSGVREWGGERVAGRAKPMVTDESGGGGQGVGLSAKSLAIMVGE